MSEKLTKEEIYQIVNSAVTVNAEMIVKKTVQEMFTYLDDEQNRKVVENVTQLAKGVSMEISKEIHTIWNQRDKDQKAKQKINNDNKLFNTRMLVMNYRKLKAHCEEIPDEIEELGDTIFEEQQLSLDVLMQEKAKTYKIMQYVDATLLAYGILSKKQGEAVERQYKVLDRLYINDSSLKVSDLEELFNISNKQVYRDRDKAIKDLSVMLFGISVIEFQ